MKKISIRHENADAGEKQKSRQRVTGVEELREKRGDCCKHFWTEDGKICAVLYGEPVHYYNAERKEYEEIDSTMRYCTAGETEDGFEGYENVSGAVKVRFAKKVKSETLMSLSKGEQKVSWRFLGQYPASQSRAAMQAETLNDVEAVAGVRAEKKKNNTGRFRTIAEANEELVKKNHGEIRYNDFVKGADLQYIVGNSRLKENIVIKEKMAGYKFAFELQTECLELGLSEKEDELEFYVTEIGEDNAARKEVVYRMPSAYMFDGAGKRSEEVSYEIENRGAGKYLLYVTADAEWVNAGNRVFPVTIDPTVIFQNTSFFTTRTISNNEDFSTSPGSTEVYAGWSKEGAEARLLLKWNASSLNAVKVLSAALNLYPSETSTEYTGYEKNFEIKENASAWNVNNVTWNTLPDQGSIVDVLDFIEAGNAKAKKSPISIDIAKVWSNPNGIVIQSMQKTPPKTNNNTNLVEHCVHFWSEKLDNQEHRPFMLVTYLEENQLQSDQQLTNSFNRAGTVSLDLFTKNLRYVHNDFTLEGNVLPLNISHVYNSRSADRKGIWGSRLFIKATEIIKRGEASWGASYRVSVV